MIIKDRNFLPEHHRVTHGFFTRQGGVSDGIFNSLNCGPGSGDDIRLVTENRGMVAQEMGVPEANLLSLYQVHGNTCLFIEEPFSGQNRPRADAFVTDRSDIALGILTADCGPVLLYGEKADGAPIIGAVHAGWGGALKGVCEATVQMMVEKGARLETLRASVGPCIGPASYEVSEDFADAFLEQAEANEHYFKSASREGHLMFDLPGYIASRLAAAGVRHVSLIGLDTYSDALRFFSYRRTTHRNETEYGRQISCISISKVK